MSTLEKLATTILAVMLAQGFGLAYCLGMFHALLRRIERNTRPHITEFKSFINRNTKGDK